MSIPPWRSRPSASRWACWPNRSGPCDPADTGKRATRKRRPVAEKESQKWLTSVEVVIAAHAQCPQTRFVGIGDREADVYDLFLQERPSGVDLLVRASWNRRVDHPERYLWAKVEAHPVAGHAHRAGVPPRRAAGSPGHRHGAGMLGAAVPAHSSARREAANPGGLGGPGPGRTTPRPGWGPLAWSVLADHLCRAHPRGCHRARDLVCLSLGDRGLA